MKDLRFRPNSFGSLAMLDAMRCPELVTNLTADRRAVVVMVAETSIERDQPVALALSGVPGSVSQLPGL